MVMKAAIYARVSTERQAERGAIGPQMEALRAHVAAAGDELAGEYCDDECSGARLDRPGLDALRDAAETGLFEVVWCLSADRLARAYAYQVLILDELARFGVSEPDDPLFPTRRGGPLTTKAVAWLLDKHTSTAAIACPPLAGKRVTPHVLRHTNAMLLRAENVDIHTIALWLGHGSTKSTEPYLHADNKLKQQAIERIAPTGTQPADTGHPTRSWPSCRRCDYPQHRRRQTPPQRRILGPRAAHCG
jgi:resolvase-like protein/integrase-like protein